MKRKNSIVNREIYEDTTSILFESFQRLQVNLEYASIDSKYQVISCVSSTKGEGKTTSLLNLAYVYSLKGFKVLVIDLDLRAPNVHHFFNISNDKGITDYLAGKVGEEEIIHKNIKENYDVITAGSRVPFPAKVLESHKIIEFLEKLKKNYDYIFVDTSPLLLFADTLIISKFIDAFIFVTSVNVSKKNEIKEATKLIKTNNLNVVGSIVCQVPLTKRQNKYGYYGY